MATGRIISDFRPASFLTRRVWFNCNRVFSKFEFIFSNPKRIRVLLLSPSPAPL